ncbi:MAG TPA: hypothetical protein VHW95_18340 [Steroidobacteraceae bacterium]|jgi:hypothetical protein|nr:hypothetical protein [Steroidobacteraceae bacterium]
MILSHRWVFLGILSLPILLSGCGSSSHGTDSGPVSPTGIGGTMPVAPVTPPKAGPVGGGVRGSDDKVSAVASVGGTLVVAVGTSQTISVTFTSTDGLPISGFSVYGSLGTLPAAWSAPSSLTCAVVGPGSGCVLTLTYAPSAVESGTLTLDCVYVDNAGLPRTPGPCMTLAYAAAANNNVVASISPAGEVDAAIGAKQTAGVTFTTDDGNAATALTVSNLGSLPAGWSSTAVGLTCAVVATGNGCQVPLMFAPTAAANGTLTLNYSYVDGSGASRSGSLNIPYATSSNGIVVANVSPTGQVNAAEAAGSRSVAVTFTTEAGKSAAGLSVITDLSKLPLGWSSPTVPFGCAGVSTGNGCQLQLQYTPTSLTSGTVSLRYSYNDASGVPNFGIANIPYAATTNDNAVGTVAPSGQITAMLGAPAQPISVIFTTDDGRLGTALRLTSSLTSLPAGWNSGTGTFTCSALSSGSACQLMLSYAPTGVDNGTLNLTYSYLNNAGDAKTGSVAIPYQTTTNDNVAGAASPLSVTAATGSINPVTVTFDTDDGNIAGALTADLSLLPADWSAPASSFACATVSVGSGCQMSLTYAPTAAASGTLAIGFSYVNSAGTTKTGTVSIPYSASP